MSDNTAPPPAFNVRASDGPVLALDDGNPRNRLTLKQRQSIEWLKARDAFEMPIQSAAHLRETWDAFSTSPGWADEAKAWAEFARIDQIDPDQKATWEADIARRKMIVQRVECVTWEDAVLALSTAGECELWPGRVSDVALERLKQKKAA